MNDDELMARAAEVGAAVRRRTAPNPWVGCVIARDGLVVGEGATHPPGGPHAEAAALAAAGDRARGATVYTTLEPCAHHGRTPPCVDALVAAGVTRVVAAIADPDPQVAGRGHAALRDAGITVDVGIGARGAEQCLAPYLVHRREARSYVVLKSATSLDGRVAAADGASRWITGEAARADAHERRADSQAILVGSGTALADRPALTVRDATGPLGPPPLRVLVDARGRVPASGPLFDSGLAPTLVVTTAQAPERARQAWAGAGVEVETIGAAPEPDPSVHPSAGGGVDLAALLVRLGARGVLQVLVEGGPTLHGAFLEAGFVDRIFAYVAPVVLGVGGRAGFGIAPGPALDRAPRYRLVGVARLGDDVRLEYEPAGDRGPRAASVSGS